MCLKPPRGGTIYICMYTCRESERQQTRVPAGCGVGCYKGTFVERNLVSARSATDMCYGLSQALAM